MKRRVARCSFFQNKLMRERTLPRHGVIPRWHGLAFRSLARSPARAASKSSAGVGLGTVASRHLVDSCLGRPSKPCDLDPAALIYRKEDVGRDGRGLYGVFVPPAVAPPLEISQCLQVKWASVGFVSSKSTSKTSLLLLDSNLDTTSQPFCTLTSTDIMDQEPTRPRHKSTDMHGPSLLAKANAPSGVIRRAFRGFTPQCDNARIRSPLPLSPRGHDAHDLLLSRHGRIWLPSTMGRGATPRSVSITQAHHV